MTDFGDAEERAPMTRTEAGDYEVVVVGAGASGIGAAIRLRQAGIDDVVVLEKAPELGGTWRDNTYPGCACDVPSALYSYSFAPNAEWTRAFAKQVEIRDYLSATALRFGVRPQVRLGAEVLRMQWDGSAQRWQLETTAGDFPARCSTPRGGITTSTSPASGSRSWAPVPRPCSSSRRSRAGSAGWSCSSAPRSGCCPSRTTMCRARNGGCCDRFRA